MIRRSSKLRSAFGLSALVLCLQLAGRGLGWVGTTTQAERPTAGRFLGQPRIALAAEADNDIVEKAKAAAEAAKLNLEAARLKAQLQELQKSTGQSSESSSPPPPPAPAATAPAAAAPAAAAPAATPGLESAISEALGVSSSSTLLDSVDASPEARSLVDASAIRQAASRLVELKRSNKDAFEAFVGRACDAVETGKGDYDGVLGDSGMWESAGTTKQDAEACFRRAVELLAAKGSASKELGRTSALDRQAVLKMIVYDQLPELYKSYAEVIELKENPNKDMDEAGQGMTVVDPSLLEGMTDEEKQAASFAKRLEMIPSEQERAKARLARFREQPLARDVTALVAASPELAELGEALRPMENRIYTSAHTAQLRELPEQEIKEKEITTISLEFNIVQLVGGLVVVIALAFFAAQGAKTALDPAQQGGGYADIEYSLKSSRK
eukprot:TRINITY_DN6060_c0_g6_i1.p2 TRINITY_DN6060_c0_g6~~TRINITY_DN6060_c0_g6_i1.p2  ORF type:complete len:441 (+),score=164.76 TRINITY_DN6060_c0_g6_i1:130-1452(+)